MPPACAIPDIGRESGSRPALASFCADLSCSIAPRLMRFNGLLPDRTFGQCFGYRNSADLSIFLRRAKDRSVARNQRSNFKPLLGLDGRGILNSGGNAAARESFRHLPEKPAYR